VVKVKDLITPPQSRESRWLSGLRSGDRALKKCSVNIFSDRASRRVRRSVASIIRSLCRIYFGMATCPELTQSHKKVVVNYQNHPKQPVVNYRNVVRHPAPNQQNTSKPLNHNHSLKLPFPKPGKIILILR